MPEYFRQSLCEAFVSTWWIRVQKWSVLVADLQTFVPHWVWAPNGAFKIWGAGRLDLQEGVMSSTIGG